MLIRCVFRIELVVHFIDNQAVDQRVDIARFSQRVHRLEQAPILAVLCSTVFLRSIRDDQLAHVGQPLHRPAYVLRFLARCPVRVKKIYRRAIRAGQ